MAPATLGMVFSHSMGSLIPSTKVSVLRVSIEESTLPTKPSMSMSLCHARGLSEGQGREFSSAESPAGGWGPPATCPGRFSTPELPERNLTGAHRRPRPAISIAQSSASLIFTINQPWRPIGSTFSMVSLRPFVGVSPQSSLCPCGEDDQLESVIRTGSEGIENGLSEPSFEPSFLRSAALVLWIFP